MLARVSAFMQALADWVGPMAAMYGWTFGGPVLTPIGDGFIEPSQLHTGNADSHRGHPSPRFTGAQAFGVVKQFQRLAGISRMHFDPSCGRQGGDRIRIEFQRTARKFSGAPV